MLFIFSSFPESKQYPDIKVGDFQAHVSQMHADSDIAFAQEFDVS